MKRSFAYLLVAALSFPLLLASLAYAQIPSLTPPNPQFPIPSKQTLTYSVDWRVFPAGTATFHLAADGTRQHVTAIAASIGTVNLLFPVADRYDSTFDRVTGCSYEYRKQIHEGRHRSAGLMQLDYGRHLQELSEKNLIDGSEKNRSSAIPGCVTDVLSGIFYVATQPLDIGRDIDFPLADGGKVVAVTVKVEGKETVVTPAGTFSAIRVQPTAAVGVVKNRGSIWIWYSDDSRHLPVQVRAHLFWGTITMRLSSVTDK